MGFLSFLPLYLSLNFLFSFQQSQISSSYTLTSLPPSNWTTNTGFSWQKNQWDAMENWASPLFSTHHPSSHHPNQPLAEPGWSGLISEIRWCSTTSSRPHNPIPLGKRSPLKETFWFFFVGVVLAQEKGAFQRIEIRIARWMYFLWICYLEGRTIY